MTDQQKTRRLPVLPSAEEVLLMVRQHLPRLKKQYGIERLAIYGSFAKGQAGRKSDVDILVQLGRPLGLKFVALAFDLEEILGRKVDISTFKTLERSATNPRYHNIAADIQQTLMYV